MKIALTGASGFIGSYVQKNFKDCVVIKREDSDKVILQKLKNVDVVINLAGAPILKRWSNNYKKIILESRINTTKKVVNAINKSSVKHFISTSAIGIYPDNKKCDESCQEIANDFLSEVAKKWEDEAKLCNKPTAILRLGVVLGKGGALKQMLIPFKLGLGGTIGDGKMMTSWIHIDDLIGMYKFIIENRLSGIYNATSPNPVSNYTFTKTLGKILKRPTIFKIPIFVLKLIYGEAAIVMSASKEVYPNAIIKKGYKFKHQTIESALKNLIN